MEALGGACWWQGDLPEMTEHYQEALELWLAIGDEAEIANAYYNASFSFAVLATGADPIPIPTGSASATSRRRGVGSI